MKVRTEPKIIGIEPDTIRFFKESWPCNNIPDSVDFICVTFVEGDLVDYWAENSQGDTVEIPQDGQPALAALLQDALEKVKTLRGLVPICANCKKIRDDKGYWNQIEGYIQKYSEVKFSHGMCPECSDKLYGEQKWYIKAKKKRLEEKS